MGGVHQQLAQRADELWDNQLKIDANGNRSTLTSGGTYYLSFGYDDENRLTRVEDVVNATFRTDFVYDGLGRMRLRLEYTNDVGTSFAGETLTASWVLATETRYLYDGNRVIQERDGANTPTVSYTRGTDLSGSLEGAGGIGGLLARSHGYSGGNWTTHNFYHADGNGNITYLVDSFQGLAASYRYEAFGNLISKSGPLADTNVYRFSSKELHVNSGLYYYLYRFYDPNLQRWLNRDPLLEPGFEFGRRGLTAVEGWWWVLKPSELFEGSNLYRFVSNNSVGGYDAFGTFVNVENPIVNPHGPCAHEAPCSRLACRAGCSSAAAAGAYACTQIKEPKASGACWAAVTILGWVCNEACALCPNP